MLCDKPEKAVIFYGAGPYLAKNLKRLRNEGYAPVCVCDIDQTKHHRPFCGRKDLQILPLAEALERYPEVPLYITVDHTALGNVLHYLTAEQDISAERILNYVPISTGWAARSLKHQSNFAPTEFLPGAIGVTLESSGATISGKTSAGLTYGGIAWLRQYASTSHRPAMAVNTLNAGGIL